MPGRTLALLLALLPGCYLVHERPSLDAAVPLDTALDAGPVPAPRPIAPTSAGRATSRRPTFRWQLAPATIGARLEVCADRACTRVLQSADVAGSLARFDEELPAGVVFWRLFGRAGGGVGAAPSATWELTIGRRDAPLDTSWGATPDPDGDGSADVVVGASAAAGGAGRVQVYAGGPGGIAAMPTTVVEGPAAGDARFGTSVASAGDVNGDGFADVVVGAPYAEMVGRAYVLLGSAAGLGSIATVIAGPADAALFGWSVSGAGDVNADGYADVVVGAAATESAGRAHVYLGGPTGIGTVASQVLEGPAGFGGSVAGAGDVNGDGFADVVIGATGNVYLGGPAGLESTPVVRLAGDPIAWGYGRWVACAGDVNADGYADIVVGADGMTYAFRARAFVYLGGPAGPSAAYSAMRAAPGTDFQYGFAVAGAGDVNADGYADVLVSGQSDPDVGAYLYFGGAAGVETDAVRLTNADPDGEGQTHALGGVGDVNGDGIDDVVIGALGEPSFAGRLFLYPGEVGGIRPFPASTLVGGDGSGAYFGFSLARAE